MARAQAVRPTAAPARADRTLLPPASLVRRVLWVVAAGLWVTSVISLVGFNAADWPSHAVAVHNDQPANLAGHPGAVIAYGLLLLFGPAVWILLLAVGGWLAVTATGRDPGQPGLRAVGAVLATVALGGLHALWLPRLGPLPGSGPGLLGLFATTELLDRFSATLTALTLLCGLLIGAITAADSVVMALPGQIWRTARQACRGVASLGALNPTPALRRLGQWLRSFHPTPAMAGAGTGESDADTAEAPASRRAPARRRVVEEDEWDEDEDEDEDEEEEDDEDWEDDEDEEDEDDDEEDDDELDSVKAEPIAHRRLSNDDLREKIAKLPVRMAGTSRPIAKDSDIPRETHPAGLPGAGVDGAFEGYKFPTLDLLDNPEGNYTERMEAFVRKQAEILEQSLQTFSIDAEVTGIESGPVVTLFSVQLAPGTRVARLQTISSDIARSLQAQNIRILPNTAGKTTVGIEVPNLQKEKVRLKELMSGGHADDMKLPMYLGKDASGEPLVGDLTKMPHMLIAGTTGSGKSVCMNSILMSWLYTKRPDELKLVLVDPKMVEMSQFADIPHLMCPVVTEMGRAAAILEWAVQRMEERYELLREAGVRDIDSYNSLTAEDLEERFQPENDLERAKIPKRMPYLVFVIDELADLMMTNKEVEHSIVRIAQKARAVGIHLILATQRPQANVVTGLIKSNMPCRVSFKVASGMDSRIVLDSKGAELLLGQGDMLYLNPKTSEIRRSQGTLVTDAEIRRVTRFLKDVAGPSFERSLMTLRANGEASGGNGSGGEGDDGERDPLFDKAVEIMIESGRGSVSLLQRRLAIGYSRASRLVDQMGLAGILGEHKGSVAREVMITKDDWLRMKEMEEQEAKEGTVFAEGDDDAGDRGA